MERDPGRPAEAGRRELHILAIMHSDAAGGPPQHVFPWLEHLARRGRVDVVVPGRGSAADLFATVGRVTTLDYRSITYPRGPGDLAPLFSRLRQEVGVFRRQITETSPDLILVVTSMLPMALIAARLERRPAIVYVGEIFDKRFVRSRGRSLAGAAMRRILGRADALVCCSDAVARQFSGATRGHVVTVHPGVSTAYAGGNGDRFRAAHGLTNASPCLAVVGNVTYGRGQDLIVRALPSIRRQLPGVHCVVAGLAHANRADLTYRRDLEALARQLGVEDRITFVGFVDRVADLYAAADIVVNPVRFNEPFGRVAIEAMSAGRPVIATRVGAIPEIMRDERDALLVDPDDDQALAAAVIRLWSDPTLRERQVDAGKRLVESRFDERVAVEKFAAIVDEVARNAGGSPQRGGSRA